MKLRVPPFSQPVESFNGWTLYALRQDDGRGSFLWPRFKLMVSDVTLPAKWGMRRSYFVVWSLEHQRIRKDHDRMALELGAPDLYALVEMCLSMNYGKDYLYDRERSGVTPKEIAEERRRLAEGRARRKAEKRAAKERQLSRDGD